MTLDGQEAEDFARAVVDSLEQLAPEILDRLNLDLERMLAEHRQIRRGFERRLDDVWGRALDRYWATYVACTEAGVLCNEAAKPGAAEENDIRFLALTRLHGRACMVASEIHALLRTGHAAGAEARWRTLHEIAVVSAVIVEADQDVAERYLLHASIDSARDLHDYERVRERLGLEAIGSAFCAMPNRCIGRSGSRELLRPVEHFRDIVRLAAGPPCGRGGPGTGPRRRC